MPLFSDPFTGRVEFLPPPPATPRPHARSIQAAWDVLQLSLTPTQLDQLAQQLATLRTALGVHDD